MRKLCALIRYLPTEAAVWGELEVGGTGWSVEAYLLADVYASFAGEQHPDHPSKKIGERLRAQQVQERLVRQRERHKRT